MRTVLDTNIFISGIFWEGNFCSQIISAWKANRFALINSPDTVQELMDTLKTFKIKMDDEMIEEWKKVIIENSVMVEPKERVEIIKDDPDDNKFIEAALAGDADYIVSQDWHLLKRGEFRGVRIVSPEEFLKILNQY